MVPEVSEAFKVLKKIENKIIIKKKTILFFLKKISFITILLYNKNKL